MQSRFNELIKKTEKLHSDAIKFRDSLSGITIIIIDINLIIFIQKTRSLLKKNNDNNKKGH